MVIYSEYKYCKQYKVIESEKEMEELINKFPGISYSEIMECCKNPKSMRKNLYKLMDDNKIFRIDETHYVEKCRCQINGKYGHQFRSFYVSNNIFNGV